MITLKLGVALLLLSASLDIAAAKSWDECAGEERACHKNCSPGGFSCDLLRNMCHQDFERCLGQYTPSQSYDDSPPRPAYQPPFPSTGTYQPPLGGGKWQN